MLQFEHHPLADRHRGVPPRWEGCFGGIYLRTRQMSSERLIPCLRKLSARRSNGSRHGPGILLY
eukprot:scaffold1761_cov16-Prasinocladus_malaysianus.AAC.1